MSTGLGQSELARVHMPGICLKTAVVTEGESINDHGMHFASVWLKGHRVTHTPFGQWRSPTVQLFITRINGILTKKGGVVIAVALRKGREGCSVAVGTRI